MFCVWYFYPCLSFKGTYSRIAIWGGYTNFSYVIVDDKFDELYFDGQVIDGLYAADHPYMKYDYQLKPFHRMILVDMHSALTPLDYRPVKLGWNTIYTWNHYEDCWDKCERVGDKVISKIKLGFSPGKDTEMAGKWESTFAEHLANVETIEILTRKNNPATLELTVTDSNDIQRLIETIRVDEEASTYVDKCCHLKTFRFKEGTNLLAEVVYRTQDFDGLRETTNDQQIRLYWRDGKWPYVDAVLTPESSKQFGEWLAEHNLKIK